MAIMYIEHQGDDGKVRLELDAVFNIAYTSAGKPTKFAVESGFSVSDHYHQEQDVLRVSGTISGGFVWIVNDSLDGALALDVIKEETIDGQDYDDLSPYDSEDADGSYEALKNMLESDISPRLPHPDNDDPRTKLEVIQQQLQSLKKSGKTFTVMFNENLNPLQNCLFSSLVLEQSETTGRFSVDVKMEIAQITIATQVGVVTGEVSLEEYADFLSEQRRVEAKKAKIESEQVEWYTIEYYHTSGAFHKVTTTRNKADAVKYHNSGGKAPTESGKQYVVKYGRLKYGKWEGGGLYSGQLFDPQINTSM